MALSVYLPLFYFSFFLSLSVFSGYLFCLSVCLSASISVCVSTSVRLLYHAVVLPSSVFSIFSFCLLVCLDIFFSLSSFFPSLCHTNTHTNPPKYDVAPVLPAELDVEQLLVPRPGAPGQKLQH